MKRISLIVAFAACAVSAFAQSEKEADDAGNLFKGKEGFTNPFQDRIARHEGDILSVIINETSNSNFGATTNLAKTDSNSITNGIPLLSGLISSLGTGATSTNAGSGTTTQTGTLTATMSVTIKKVLPNGNLVIEGTRWIKVNKEIQSFKLSGIIRADDVQSNNTILSSKIQEAQISMDGKGAIADRQRRGLLTRVLDWLF